MADGQFWVFGGNQAFLLTLERETGMPAFCFLADDEDFGATRIFHLAYSLSTTYRETVGRCRTWAEFIDSNPMPRYASPEWFALAKALQGLVSKTFPEAVAMGRPMTAAIRALRDPGQAASFLDTQEKQQAAQQKSDSIESTGSNADTMPTLS